MREIKFRAWNKAEGKMYYGSPEVDPKNCGNLIYCDMETLAVGLDGSLYLIDECGNYEYPENFGLSYELMQYTGLKDKNGVEIYEGDIVIGQEKEAGFPPYDSMKPRIIEFRNGCWCFNAGRYDNGDWIRFGFWTYSNEGKEQLKQLEVIGNIYENPELLEG